MCFVSSVDEHFIGLIGKYVNEGMAKDVDSLQTDKRKSPEQFWQLLRSASKDMECELERFRKRLQAIRIFLDRCSGGSHSIAATQDLVPKKVGKLCLCLCLSDMSHIRLIVLPKRLPHGCPIKWKQFEALRRKQSIFFSKRLL